MKIEIKWLNNEWHAFGKETLKSAGISDICDQVRDELGPQLKPGEEIQWEAKMEN